MLVRRLPKLLPALQFNFSFQRVRNIIPLDPVFPENESTGIYRPLYEKRDKSIKTPQQLLQVKVNAIVARAKKSTKVRLSKVENIRPALKTREEKDQFLMEMFKNVMIDKETGLPIGLEYDDYVKAVKNKSTQHKESKYLDNLQLLIRKLGLANESDLASLHKHFLADMNKRDFLSQVHYARIKFFQNFIKELDKLKAENKLDQFLTDKFNLDKKPNSKEFILASLKEGKTSRVEDLVKFEVTDEIGREIAFNNINEKVAEYRQIKSKLNELEDINPYKEALKGDPLFDPNHTLSEQSDLERLDGQRLQRDPTFDEELNNDPEYIKRKDTVSLIQRNYFRNKIEYFQLKSIEQSQNKLTEIADVNLEKAKIKDENNYSPQQIIDEKLFSILNNDEDDFLLQREADSINESIGKPASYEEIYQRIDYILLQAPKYLQELAKNKKDCDEKPFNPQTLQANFKQSDLLWDQFNTNFPVLFPYSWQKDESFTNQKNSVSQDPQVIKEESIYALELYKEFQKPQNEKFFKHYLTDYMQFQQDEIEQAIRQNHESIQPTTFQEDYTKFLQQEDEDFEDTVHDIEDAEKNRNIEDFKPQDIYSQFNDAKDEYYTGRGRRKSCQCTVKITKGYGKCTVNGKDVLEYMPPPLYRHMAMIPIELSGLSCYIDVEVRIRGSGVSSQADAIASAIARALVKMCPGLKKRFRDINMTKTDRREVERKHTGLLKARKKWPYSRR